MFATWTSHGRPSIYVVDRLWVRERARADGSRRLAIPRLAETDFEIGGRADSNCNQTVMSGRL